MSCRVLHACMIGALTVSGCGHNASAPRDANVPSREAPPAYRVEQVQFGQQARYVVCLDAACPTRTPKTRASAAEAAEREAAPVVRTQRLSVFLPSGKSRLPASAKTVLREAAAMARQAKQIAIVGYTDSTGHEQANTALALARARAVGEYLRRQVPEAAGRIDVKSAGACCFVAANDTEDGRARNRRVELVFTMAG